MQDYQRPYRPLLDVEEEEISENFDLLEKSLLTLRVSMENMVHTFLISHQRYSLSRLPNIWYVRNNSNILNEQKLHVNY